MSRRARTRPASRRCSEASCPGSSCSASARTGAMSSRLGNRLGRPLMAASLFGVALTEAALDGFESLDNLGQLLLDRAEAAPPRPPREAPQRTGCRRPKHSHQLVSNRLGVRAQLDKDLRTDAL